MARTSRYEADLRRRLRDPDRWPGFSNPGLLNRLEVAAYGALSRARREGALASTLIHHQLVEEMVRLLIEDSRFFIQLAIFPAQVSFRPHERLTFGQLLARLEGTPEFPGKREFLRDAAKLNTLRIEVAHRLISRGSIGGLRRLADRAHRIYDKCFDRFDAAHDHFRVCFKDFRKDVFDEIGNGRSNQRLQPTARVSSSQSSKERARRG